MTVGSGISLWNTALGKSLATVGGGRKTPGVNALEVVEGLHLGASAELEERQYTIGSSTESDVVLCDAGIAPVHVRLNRNGGMIEVEAVGGAVELADGQVIPQGHGRRCRLPLEASIGGAKIKLTGPAPARTMPNPGKRLPFLAAGLAIAVFAVTATANGLSLPKAEKAPNQVLTASLAPQGAAPGGDADVEEQLRLRLEEAGIRGLDIEEASGRIIASGTIPEHQRKAWSDVQSWFDRSYSDRALLVSDVSVGDVTQTPRLVLQAIWYGERPYVITADGARYYEGAFTNDGWTIEKIGERELLLAKGSAKVALKYP